MAMEFVRASSEYLGISTPITARPLTLACHFYLTSEQLQALVQISDTASGSWQGWSLAQLGAGASYVLTAQEENSTTAQRADSAAAPTQNTWHTALAIFNSNTDRRLWFNGTKYTNTTSLSTPTSQDELTVGASRNNATTSSYLDGYVCEVGVWNVALDDDEAAAYCDGVSPLMIRPDALTNYLPLIRDSGAIIDRVNGSWTINGTPTDQVHDRVFYGGRSSVLPLGTAVATATIAGGINRGLINNGLINGGLSRM